MTEYFAMGGYAAFVWPAYAVTLVVLVGLVVMSLRTLRRREAMVRALTAARPARPNARTGARTSKHVGTPPPHDSTTRPKITGAESAARSGSQGDNP